MRLWRYCLAGLLYDWLAFVFWTVVPIRAEDFKASATQLALLQAASTVFYVANSLYIGKLSDRVSKWLLCVLGCWGAIAACAMTVYSNSLTALFLVVPVMGIGGSLFWPSLQGAIGCEADPARMERALGIFNVMWSIGKTLGFATAGWLTGTYGYRDALWIAAATAIPILFLLPRLAAPKREAAAQPAPADRGVFRTMSYVANFVSFGVGATLQNQFYKYLDQGVPMTMWKVTTYFGLFLGATFAAQTLTFLVLQRSTAWTYRRGLLYGTQVAGAVAVLALTLTRSDAVLLAVAPFVGIGIGFVYASSIYYSLHGPSDHGKYAGLHEAVLGSGTLVLPMAGGVLADLFRDLRAPYWMAAVAALGAVAVQEAIYRRRPIS